MKPQYLSDNWERMVILELIQEHKNTCHYHRVQLKSVTIHLFDSETLWGQYYHQTQTISIARKLVTDFDWQFVLGVFRHEMAHQFVAEKYENSGSYTPHGPHFAEACQRLGVPEPFRKAGLHLRSHPIDWRKLPINETSEKLMDKTKKLLALANSTNVHEAQSAMEKVREIYAKHNLAQFENYQQEGFTHLVIPLHKKRMMAWEKRLVSILSEHFFIKTLLLNQFDQKQLETFCAIELIGRKENVLMAEYVYHFILQQTETALRYAVENLGLAKTQRRSFRIGVIDGFDTKLELSRQQSKNHATSSKTTNSSNDPSVPIVKLQEPNNTVIANALKGFKNNTEINRYIKTIYPRLRHSHSCGSNLNPNAYSAGQAAGQNINLKKPITSSHLRFGGLLT